MFSCAPTEWQGLIPGPQEETLAPQQAWTHPLAGDVWGLGVAVVGPALSCLEEDFQLSSLPFYLWGSTSALFPHTHL